jgi:hypothetical protein
MVLIKRPEEKMRNVGMLFTICQRSIRSEEEEEEEELTP